MARIITVYTSHPRTAQAHDMSTIRWYRLSEALAGFGHQVDIAIPTSLWHRTKLGADEPQNPRRVPLHRVRWHEYEVVKTELHNGFRTLEKYGGVRHPFVIGMLGSVVGPRDMPGIYFYGRDRRRLYQIQQRIHRASTYLTLLTDPAKQLWFRCFGERENVLIVPGAADERIPEPRADPYPSDSAIRCIFAGNFYAGRRKSQPQAHHTLVAKLNRLGSVLQANGARLYVLGPGDPARFDRRLVTYLGAVPHSQVWDYLYFASVGVVVAAGPFMQNNESTKIYYYLRAGLPVVSESGFPNDDVVRESGLGFVVENGRLSEMGDRIIEAARRSWDRERAVRYILDNHTWEKRAHVYDEVIRQHGGA